MIEWTDRTWNPTRGCSRVSEGCRNCYAERIAARYSTARGKAGLHKAKAAFAGFAQMRNGEPHWTGRVELIPSKLDEPLRWKKPARIFVNSMSDLFHENLAHEDIGAVFATMSGAPQHTFQILTKRPAQMLAFFEWCGAEADECGGNLEDFGWPLPNVWLGVSVEDQATADERIPLLLQTPAAVRFVSYEPALGPVDFTCIDGGSMNPEFRGVAFDALHGGGTECNPPSPWGLDWLIVGGESGPGARQFDLTWARDTIAQCKAASVPVFVKQLGARPFAREGGVLFYPDLPLRDRKGGDPSEWPEDLRVRQFPKGEPR